MSTIVSPSATESAAAPRQHPCARLLSAGYAAVTWARCPRSWGCSCSARRSRVMRPSFLSAGNFANLFTQGAAVTVIAMGLVFVLLLGEIDLSAGFTSGVCAAVLAVLLTNNGWPWYAAVVAALLAGAVIGLVLGSLVARLGIPSFVVTLAAFLAFQGVLLALVNEGTNISVRDQTILPSRTGTCPRWPAGWCSPSESPATPRVQLLRARNRTKRGLAVDPIALIAFRIGALALLARCRRLRAQPGAQPQRDRGVAQGRADRHPDHRRAAHRLDVRAAPHRVRAARLRRRREPGGRPPGRHQRRPHPHLGVRDLLDDGGDRRRHRGVPCQLGRPEHRREQRAALCRRRRGHRRYEPVRRQGPGPRRGPRWRGGRRDRQRHGPDGLQRGRQVHRDRPRPAARGGRGRTVQASGPRLSPA